jgi:hypothetical protein
MTPKIILVILFLLKKMVVEQSAIDIHGLHSITHPLSPTWVLSAAFFCISKRFNLARYAPLNSWTIMRDYQTFCTTNKYVVLLKNSL